MLSEIEAKRLSDWLAAIATTQDEEIDCDVFLELMEKVVQAAMTGADVRSLLPNVALHLDHCPDCRDLYETLLALMREDAKSP